MISRDLDGTFPIVWRFSHNFLYQICTNRQAFWPFCAFWHIVESASYVESTGRMVQLPPPPPDLISSITYSYYQFPAEAFLYAN